MKRYSKKHKRAKTRSRGGRKSEFPNEPSRQTASVVIDVDQHLQEAQESKTEAPVFWTKCDDCNIAYLYYTTTIGKRVHCRHCCQRFIAAEATSLSPHIDKYIRLSQPASLKHDISSGVVSASSPHQQHDEEDQNGGLDSKAFVKSEAESQRNKNADGGRERVRIGDTDMVVAGMESTEKSVSEIPISSSNTTFPGNALFKQGIGLMIRGFKDKVQSAVVEQLDDLLFYGRMALGNITDFGLPDPGIGVLLRNLELQAAEIMECRLAVSRSEEVHASYTDKANEADSRKSDAYALVASLSKQAVDLTLSVRRADASVAELKEKEEMIRRARIEAEEELTCKKEQLVACEASLSEATEAWKEMEDTHNKTKELMAMAQKDLQSANEVLVAREGKWKRLCGEALEKEALPV